MNAIRGKISYPEPERPLYQVLETSGSGGKIKVIFETQDLDSAILQFTAQITLPGRLLRRSFRGELLWIARTNSSLGDLK